MSDQLIVEREGLEKKDKGELQDIVSALGGTATARMRKVELIDQIMRLTGMSAEETVDATKEADHPVGPDGEPLADWEVQVLEEGEDPAAKDQARPRRGQRPNNNDRKNNQSAKTQGAKSEQDDDPNRRAKRRSRGRGRDREDAGNDPISDNPIEVEGYLDLREEGYAFLRINGFLPSKDDAYVSVKQVRQHRLRKGDHLIGASRPAARNEKNPALHEIHEINGTAADQLGERVDFDELTAIYPNERLELERDDDSSDPLNRIIDLWCPLGKGQRGIIISPRNAGRSTTIKSIVSAVETNNPEVVVMVLLVDERPEDATGLRRHLTTGEVVASTFDKSPEEHTAVAEITLERARRMVENGKDVMLIIDGITQLARAYNMSVPQTGRVMHGGLDTAALYPPKRFLGAARNIENGGSLTVLATALTETGSSIDDVILREIEGAANWMLYLDQDLAADRVFPAVDLSKSANRSEEGLRESAELQAISRLRESLAADHLEPKAASRALLDQLLAKIETHKTNQELLQSL